VFSNVSVSDAGSENGVQLKPMPDHYNLRVRAQFTSLDTAPEIERLQVERWRQMSAADKAAIVSGLTHAVYELALAGIRHRHPQASTREQFLRLAIVTLGSDLACKVYPEIVTTDLR
jgi:hypothetical protein